MLSHHETAGFFPSGGWGWYLVGDPDRGTGRNQPGGWCYAVLPYLDQKPLYQMGAGMTDAQKMVVNATRIATAVPTFNCPSRRRTVVEVSTSDAPYNSNPAPYAAKTDYAANSGYPYPYYPYSVQGPPRSPKATPGRHRMPGPTSPPSAKASFTFAARFPSP